MARFLIETVADSDGMVFAQTFTEPGAELVARSEAIFHTHDEADAAIREMFAQAWPDKSPFAVDSSIGV